MEKVGLGNHVATAVAFDSHRSVNRSGRALGIQREKALCRAPLSKQQAIAFPRDTTFDPGHFESDRQNRSNSEGKHFQASCSATSMGRASHDCCRERPPGEQSAAPLSVCNKRMECGDGHFSWKPTSGSFGSGQSEFAMELDSRSIPYVAARLARQIYRDRSTDI